MQDLIRGAISNTLSWNNLNQSLRRRHELIQSPSSYGIFSSIDSINSDIFVNEILEKVYDKCVELI